MGYGFNFAALLLIFQLLLAPATTNEVVFNFQTTHKMGSLMLKQFKNERFAKSKNTFKWRISPKVKDPTVVLVRDMFDATISGYLYHKGGHECWLNHLNRVNPLPRGGNDWLRGTDWTRYVSHIPHNLTYPETNLCEALNIVNETIGLGIYLEFARNQFYKSVAKLKARTEDPTLFLCFDELLEDQNWNETEMRVRSFFADASNRDHRRLVANGHATSHDPVLRSRLHAILREVDCSYFSCETKEWNDALGCRGDFSNDSGEEEEPLVEFSNGSGEEEPLVKEVMTVSLWFRWLLFACFATWIYFWKRIKSASRRNRGGSHRPIATDAGNKDKLHRRRVLRRWSR